MIYWCPCKYFSHYPKYVFKKREKTIYPTIYINIKKNYKMKLPKYDIFKFHFFCWHIFLYQLQFMQANRRCLLWVMVHSCHWCQQPLHQYPVWPWHPLFTKINFILNLKITYLQLIVRKVFLTDNSWSYL